VQVQWLTAQFSRPCVLKPKFHYADFPETSGRDTRHGEVSGEVIDLSPGSRRHGSCYGEVTGMFRGIKLSRGVEMVRKIPATSWQQARLRPRIYKKRENRRRPRQDTGKSATSRTNQRGRQWFVADLSRTSTRERRHSGIWAWLNTTVKLPHILVFLSFYVNSSILFTQPPMRRMRICFTDVFFVFFCFFAFVVFFRQPQKYQTTVLGNGWTDFHETFTER